MDNYKVIIQNLARRADRYHVAVGVLIGQGVPPTHIERFDAHDGALYWNTRIISHQANVNARILHRYGNGKYIEECYEGWDVYTYCYCWSWYEIVDSIARESDDNIPTLVLIDDWQLTLSHSEVVAQITKLYGMSEPFHILQYVHSTAASERTPSQTNQRLTPVPNIQHGITGTGDGALLISPLGARRLIQFADEHPEHAPEVLMYYFSQEADNAGCYAVVEHSAKVIDSTGVYSSFQDRCTVTDGKHVEYIEDK